MLFGEEAEKGKIIMSFLHHVHGHTHTHIHASLGGGFPGLSLILYSAVCIFDYYYYYGRDDDE